MDASTKAFYKLANDIYGRSQILYELLSTQVAQKSYGDILGFDEKALNKNATLLGIYLQHKLTSQITELALDLSYFAIAGYILDAFSDATLEERTEKLNQIFYEEMGKFDDIMQGKAPVHYGLGGLPIPGSFTDNEFYRYTVWLIENSLCDRRPIFDFDCTSAVFDIINSWFMKTVELIAPDDFLLIKDVKLD